MCADAGRQEECVYTKATADSATGTSAIWYCLLVRRLEELERSAGAARQRVRQTSTVHSNPPLDSGQSRSTSRGGEGRNTHVHTYFVLTMQTVDAPTAPCETQDAPPRRLEEKRLPVVWSTLARKRPMSKRYIPSKVESKAVEASERRE